MPESGWLVVSLLASEAEFTAGVARLVKYFAEQSGTHHSTHSNV